MALTILGVVLGAVVSMAPLKKGGIFAPHASVVK